MPADVFKALDDIEYGFMREKLEAEFASELPAHSTHPLSTPFQPPVKSLKLSAPQNSTKSRPPNAPPTVRR